MPFERIPIEAVPLTVEQAEVMEQRQIKKHQVAVVLIHWFNAIVWLLELATGTALIVAPAYRVAPQWYLTMMEESFGSRANLLRFHIAVGLTWTCVFLVYAIFGWRHYLHAEVLRKEVGLDKDDLDWLRIRVAILLRGRRQRLPAQGAYNAGQKMYALLVYAMVPVIMLTGIIMTFHVMGAWAVAWSMVLHFFAVGMVVSGLMIHVYMGAVFPEERPAFYSMITGKVNELYAYHHHFKWWRDVRLEQQAWEKRLAEQEGGNEDGADVTVQNRTATQTTA